MPESRIQFGLVATCESTRVVLPLKAVQCEFLVEGGLAQVTVTQVFLQENKAPMDCLYQFPLPADASVYACEVLINDRVIRAKVEEREAARRLVEQKKAEGRRTALVEAERENLFTLSLGNLQPEDLIEVRLAYIQPLRRSAAGISLTVPFCPGIRYLPGHPLLRSNRGKGVVDDTDQVPDASRISPVRMDQFHPDAAFVEIEGRIEAGFADAASVTSPSHRITARSEDGFLRIGLDDRGDVPDRDFVLRWNEKTAAATAPRAWIYRKDQEFYALMEIRAPERVSETAVLPQDVYFLLDRSGSMAGQKWQKAVEALQNCVGTLAPQDRVMATVFEATFNDFAEAPLPPAELLQDPNFRNLSRMGTGGGTEMGPALAHVLDLVRKHSSSRRANLVLVTDAQVGNEREILEIMRRAPGLPVHCFGIDIALNDALLLALTRQQGGTFHSFSPNDDISAAVAALGRTLRQPVLLDLRLSNDWECGDRRLPDLYAGQVQYACAKSSRESLLSITARDAAGKAVEMQFATAAARNAAPFLHWCKTRIQRLLAEDARSTAAIELSKAANVICELTAFVAWDAVEKMVVATHQLIQPTFSVHDAAPRCTVLTMEPHYPQRAIATMPPQLPEPEPPPLPPGDISTAVPEEKSQDRMHDDFLQFLAARLWKCPICERLFDAHLPLRLHLVETHGSEIWRRTRVSPRIPHPNNAEEDRPTQLRVCGHCLELGNPEPHIVAEYADRTPDVGMSDHIRDEHPNPHGPLRITFKVVSDPEAIDGFMEQQTLIEICECLHSGCDEIQSGAESMALHWAEQHCDRPSYEQVRRAYLEDPDRFRRPRATFLERAAEDEARRRLSVVAADDGYIIHHSPPTPRVRSRSGECVVFVERESVRFLDRELDELLECEGFRSGDETSGDDSWSESRQQTVRIELRFCNIIDGFIPLVKDVRSILPPLTDGETVAVCWQGEPDSWFSCKVSRSKRAIYNLEGRLKRIFAPFPSGVRLYITRVGQRKYQLECRRHPHTVPNCKVFVSDGRGAWDIEIHDQEFVEWETGDQVFRHQMSFHQMEAIRAEAQRTNLSVRDAVHEVMKRLGQSQPVHVRTVHDAVFLWMRTCSLAAVWAQFRPEYLCYVRVKPGWYQFDPSKPLPKVCVLPPEVSSGTKPLRAAEHRSIYRVTERGWSHNVYKGRLEEVRSKGDACLEVRCAFGTKNEKVFTIPLSYLFENVLPRAQLDHRRRYTFQVNTTDLSFTWQLGVRMEGVPFLV